jgi:hyperosmotically inducible protein
MKMALTALGILTVLGCNQPGGAEPAPDNTANNERDRGAMMKTPGDQGGSETDRTITQQIRKDVVGDDALSVSGKNVKIVTVDGVVTLRGPVATAQEKAQIAQLVHKVDGVKRVDNQIEVAAK